MTAAQPRPHTPASGFTGVLTTAHRGSYFIKAVPAHLPTADRYRAEARITAALPPAVPAPRLLWSAELAGHVVLCFIAVIGRTPRTPWQADELHAALRTQTAAAAALGDPPAPLHDRITTHFSQTAAEHYANWAAITAGAQPTPDLPTWACRQLPLLAELEAMLPELTADATSIIHGHLHLDNLIILNRYNWTLITSWASAQRGPSWVDTVRLLIDAGAERTDTDHLLARHPTADTIPPRGVEALLAAYAGHLLVGSGGPDPAWPSPGVGHRRSGLAALDWLYRRLQN